MLTSFALCSWIIFKSSDCELENYSIKENTREYEMVETANTTSVDSHHAIIETMSDWIFMLISLALLLIMVSGSVLIASAIAIMIRFKEV